MGDAFWGLLKLSAAELFLAAALVAAIIVAVVAWLLSTHGVPPWPRWVGGRGAPQRALGPDKQKPRKRDGAW
jgi:hypothetical protein